VRRDRIDIFAPGIGGNLYQLQQMSDNPGVFRFSRNPLYLSLTLLYIGISLLFNALWALLLLLPLLVIVQIGVIQREEVYLERKFSDEYLRYKAQVRRWL
jgi:protein-S-isoprenylcysteine O-methyltransferase Ste14